MFWIDLERKLVRGRRIKELLYLHRWAKTGIKGRENLQKYREMTTHYSNASGGSEEQVHLMNDEEHESESPQSSRLNRKSLVIFFGITAVAVAIVVGTVMVSLYSGKR